MIVTTTLPFGYLKFNPKLRSPNFNDFKGYKIKAAFKILEII